MNAKIMISMAKGRLIRIELSNFRRDDEAIIANKDSKIKMSPKVHIYIYITT